MIETEQQIEESNKFFKEALTELQETGVPFLLGGAFAAREYTGVYRHTKDLDIFCMAESYPAILKCLEEKGYRIELTDIRWLAKAFHGEYFIDIIFGSVNNICRVDDEWFKYAPDAEVLGLQVKLTPPEEVIWCKIFIQNRERFDGADINHLWLVYGKKLDWKRLLHRVGAHWQLLLAHILIFQFVYPSDHRSIIPGWLLEELLQRMKNQSELPEPVEKVCMGPLIDNTQYAIDILEWNYKVTTIMTV